MAWAKCSMTNAKIPIYGIKRLISSSDPAWERTDDAVGFTATASVGTVAGSSSFDKIMPWAGIIRSTFDTGDVMVKIPEFWYRRWQEDGYEYIQIAEKKASNKFEKHPGSGRYIGAYETSNANQSRSGASYTASRTRASFRSSAIAKGSGWSLADIATWSAVTLLYLVEYSNNNSQALIGLGTSSRSDSATKTGTCDTVPNLTGRPSGNDGYYGVIYRGIENPWGNGWEWVDGINFKDGTYYISNDVKSYADDTATGYKALSYTGLTNWKNSYITKLGFDENLPWAMLPTEAGSGTSTTYFCDGIRTTTGWRCMMKNGDYGQSALNGIFTSGFTYSSTSSEYIITSRLMYSN